MGDYINLPPTSQGRDQFDTAGPQMACNVRPANLGYLPAQMYYTRQVTYGLSFSVDDSVLSTLPIHCIMRNYETVEGSVRPSICAIDRQHQRHVTGLLLSAPRVGDVDRQLRAPCSRRRHSAATASQHGAEAQRSAADAGSVMLTADGRG